MPNPTNLSPPGGSIPFKDAIRHYVPNKLWKAYDKAVEQWNSLPSKPDYFSMSVREWRAATAARSKNTSRNAYEKRAQCWSDIVDALKTRLKSGELVAFTQLHPPSSDWQEIPSELWDELVIVNVVRGVVAGSEYRLNRVHIRENDFELNSPAVTGAPGRPSKHMHLILREHSERIANGKIVDSVKNQSIELHDWFLKNHPGKEPPTAKTIENRIRDNHRKAKSDIEATLMHPKK